MVSVPEGFSLNPSISVSERLRSGRKLAKELLRPIRRHFYLTDHVFPEKEALVSTDVTNVRELIPARRVQISSPETDPFVPVGKYFREGWVDQPAVVVCDIPDAYLYLENGTICTRNWKVVTDLKYRLGAFSQYGKRKPAEVTKLTGNYSTAAYCVAWNYYHWMVDVLPKVVSVIEAEPTAEIIFAMPESTGMVQRESLAAILPPRFRVEYLPTTSWVQVDRLVWSSLASGRCNAFLPPNYYEAIRRPIFNKFHLPAVHTQKERLYITRRGARARRVLNEDALWAFLEPYGFRLVELDKMTFREQVELFHRADIVVGPHGAGFNLIYFAGKIKLVVLHPNQVPQNQFHTLARGLGQDYHFVLHSGLNEEANFEADIPALQRVLEEELGLRPGVTLTDALALGLEKRKGPPTESLPAIR